ncbi:ATP-dependent endonuclease [Corynebacterium sp. CNJ-954]|uniref:ATP-dependent nuclease n=1 Tax=Corynebacterium sp. CNJ-954 TaxID=1904962 RepID=UPI00096504E2|nr:AAA family ATPase [Corynebacterium sp. CNJ-954]OLT55274.1 ATP-dependent endonuclease [Corynebacterium sp. CNJ-954]
MINKIIIQGYRTFRSLTIDPDPEMNIIIGDNEAGKSTLLEAITLALSGRIDGRWANEELNPYWFNAADVSDYLAAYAQHPYAPSPSITIELYFDSDDPDVQRLRGVHNSLQEDRPGVKLQVALNPDYDEEFAAYMAEPGRPDVLPTEYFEAQWTNFNDEQLRRRPAALGLSVIDSRTIRSKAGVDYHTREILSAFLDPKERAAISVAHRKSRHEMTTSALNELNDKVRQGSEDLHDAPLGLAMDQSSQASWESGVVPHVDGTPFTMSGQGQQASIKVALAMKRRAESARTVLIEEPETHLAYGRLQKLLERVAALAGESQQLFVTTHSSFVLNRLGLHKLICLHGDTATHLTDLSKDTVSYFKHLSGYDTLRLVLASRLVLVEGPSDEMVFKRGYADRFGKPPEAGGIDVISMNGITFKRALELCTRLNRDVVALQDNDGTPATDITSELSEYLSDKRKMYIGEPTLGKTLEPQLITANGVDNMRKILKLRPQDNPETWMPNHKTEGALRILQTKEPVAMPVYIQQAIEHFA